MNGNNYKPSSFTLTSTSTKVLDANRDRSALILFNTGANTMTFNIGTGNISIPAGDHVAFLTRPPINTIYAASASGSTLVVWEA